MTNRVMKTSPAAREQQGQTADFKKELGMMEAKLWPITAVRWAETQ